MCGTERSLASAGARRKRTRGGGLEEVNAKDDQEGLNGMALASLHEDEVVDQRHDQDCHGKERRSGYPAAQCEGKAEESGNAGEAEVEVAGIFDPGGVERGVWNTGPEV